MLLRHSAIYLFARGVPGILGFATIVIYTRLLSPEAYGQYSIVVAGALLINAILYHWLNASLLRFLPQYRDNEADFLVTVLNGFIFISFLTGAVGALLVLMWDDPDWNRLVLIGILLVWVQAWFNINLELARSRLAPTRYGVISLFKAVVALAFGAVLVLWGLGADGALFGLMIGLLVSAVWASWGEWGTLRLFQLDSKLVKSMLAYGLPLTASFALSAVLSSSDRLMLAWFINESATGLYAAGQVLSQQSVGVLMTMVHLAAFPLIVQALERSGPKAARELLRKNAILLLAVGLPITAVFIVLAPGFANIFLGKEFQAVGIELIPWFALSTFLASVRAYYFDLAFFLGKRTQFQLVVMSTAAVLNVVFNLWLIPVYGLLGAVHASVVANGAAVVLSAILGCRAFPLPSLNGDGIRLLVATLVMVASLFIISDTESILRLLLSITVSSCVYLACLLVMDLYGIRKAMMRYIVTFKRTLLRKID